ncbi:MAG: MinD/ParA family protein [Tindallia sp. MSAO_Bac2]|nr:MAG: MinD/ParA family protein [Tindallia sp. MSAO_Bac2]
MTDQAGKLRTLVKNRISTEKTGTENGALDTNPPTKPHFICITSGKGGVGKTNFSINLGIALTRQGMRTLVIDADFGLANVDVVLGTITKYTFMNLMDENLSVENILGEGPEGLKIISGGSGLLNVLDMSEEKLQRIIQRFNELNTLFDIVIIDTGAGLTKNILSFVNASDETILVTTPEPTSLTDAYAMIKAISREPERTKVSVVVNRAETHEEADQNFEKLLNASMKFLNFPIHSLGIILDDYRVKKSVQLQVPFLIKYPNSIASRNVELISRKVLNHNIDDAPHEVKESNFVKRFINIFK